MTDLHDRRLLGVSDLYHGYCVIDLLLMWY